MRAKFKCDSVMNYFGASEATLSAVTNDDDKENQEFNEFTPSGTLTIHIDKKGAMNYFVPGKEYYLDFTEAEE